MHSRSTLPTLSGTITPCRPRRAERCGPPHATGRRTLPGEMEVAVDNPERCYRLWVNLRGGSCDFDDCALALAGRYGWTEGETQDLFETIASAWEWILERNATWAELRRAAVEVFFEVRGDDAVEGSEYDKRSWDQIVEDVQFASGTCEACRLGIDASAGEHRELAGWVAAGRVTWEKVAAKMHDLRRAQHGLT